MIDPDASKAVFDWIPTIVGLVGVLVGALGSCLSQILVELHRERKANRLHSGREAILLEMLNNPSFEWRQLTTLASVIGCAEEPTKDLLIAVGARGSEKQSGMWGLKSRHPLDSVDGF